MANLIRLKDEAELVSTIVTIKVSVREFRQQLGFASGSLMPDRYLKLEQQLTAELSSWIAAKAVDQVAAKYSASQSRRMEQEEARALEPPEQEEAKALEPPEQEEAKALEPPESGEGLSEVNGIYFLQWQKIGPQ